MERSYSAYFYIHGLSKKQRERIVETNRMLQGQ